MDDPYIFARYARNLWRFGDVLWNPGEPRVEGVSSWLWLIVYVISVRVLPDPVLLARLVGVVVGVFLVMSFAREVRRSACEAWPGAAALALVVFSPSLPYYAACGMDHIAWCLFSWLYLLWVAGAEGVGPRHMVVAALSILIRPEGFLLLLPATALCVIDIGRRKGAAKSLIVALGLAAAVLAALAGLRYALFARWLPNAAAAKHAGGSVLLRSLDGAVYLGEGIGLYIAVPAVAIAMAASPGIRTLARLPRERRLLVAAITLVLGIVLFTIVAGGDDVSAFGGTRLITPTIVPATYVLFLGLRSIVDVPFSRLRIAAVVLVTLAARLPSAVDILRQATRATNVSSPADVLLAWQAKLRPQALSPLSEYLRLNTPKGEYIAVPWAGLIPWETDLPTIDLLGLNDPHIAQASVSGRGGPDQRYDPDYVLAKRPYFICENFAVREPLAQTALLDDSALRALGAFKAGQRRLLRHPRLLAEYEVDKDAPTPGTCFRRRTSASAR